jgi:hypothetical protein
MIPNAKHHGADYPVGTYIHMLDVRRTRIAGDASSFDREVCESALFSRFRKLMS